MATQGGHGVDLKINTGSLTSVVHLMDVSFPEQEKFLAEATYHDSASAYLEYIDTGLRQLTEFEATVAWDDTATTHAQVLTSFAASTAVGMSIEDPLGQEVIAFDAHIRKVGRVAQSRELYQCVITIQPTGGPTIT
jgi:hypothetical protein